MKIRVFEAFAGYGSQSLALERLKRNFPNFDYEVVGISEIDKYAIDAYNALHPGVTNYGDISKINWDEVPDFDLFTYSSPCFVAGTLVQTAKGYVPIESIRVGDNVLTHNNTYCEVEKIGYKPSSDLYRIKGMMFDDIICTGEHPFYTRRLYRKWDNSNRCYHRLFQSPKWVNAKNLAKDIYLGYAINTKSELPVWDGSIDNRWGHNKKVNKLQPLLDKSAFWYIMGRYIGDGWKRTNETYGSGIIICCSDRNFDSLVSALNELNLHYHQTNERTVTKLHISMKELNAFVDRYGYYAHGKRIDAETLNLPVDLLKSFLDGVLDSDGCFSNNEYKITSVSRHLVYGLQQCIVKVYHCPVKMYKVIRPKTTVIEGRTVNQRDTYTIVWHTDKRKQDKAFYEEGYVWFPIKTVQKQEGINIVYNIQVVNDHSYTANGAIVHNCQDFSSAGLQRGGQEGSGTRSSLLWECRRAIIAKKPKFLLLENVAALVSEKFLPLFNKWQAELESYGYSNFAQVLNAKDYGVPQNRERVFMVSVRNDVRLRYHFPQPFKLEKRLKDVLEVNVDEKYYLSDKMLNYFERVNADKSHGHNFTPKQGADVAFTIRTTPGQRVDDNFILTEGYCSNSQNGRVVNPKGLSPAMVNGEKDGSPKILEQCDNLFVAKALI